MAPGASQHRTPTIPESVSCHPTAHDSEDLDAELAAGTASAEDVGPFFQWGDIGRLRRRLAAQAEPGTFHLGASLTGRAQVLTLMLAMQLFQQWLECSCT